MVYDEDREHRRFDRGYEFDRGTYGRRSFGRSEESRWPEESSWGYGREYDEGYPERYRSGETRSFESEGRPELTGGATEFHPVTTRRYGVERYPIDFGWQPEGGFGQGSGYLYGWSSGEQGFDTRSYRTPQPFGEYYATDATDSYGTFRPYSGYYGVSRHLATIPRGRFTGLGPKGYERSDERIREDVNEELYRNGEIDASNIEVRVQNRKVTLEGDVETREQKRLAEDLVEACPGVREVDNNLHVRRGFFARLFGIDSEEDEKRYAAREAR